VSTVDLVDLSFPLSLFLGIGCVSFGHSTVPWASQICWALHFMATSFGLPRSMVTRLGHLHSFPNSARWQGWSVVIMVLVYLMMIRSIIVRFVLVPCGSGSLRMISTAGFGLLQFYPTIHCHDYHLPINALHALAYRQHSSHYNSLTLTHTQLFHHRHPLACIRRCIIGAYRL